VATTAAILRFIAPPDHVTPRAIWNVTRPSASVTTGRGITFSERHVWLFPDAGGGSVALTEAARFGMLRPHAVDSPDRPTRSFSLRVRRLPIPARSDRACGALVSAVRPVLPGRRGATPGTRHRGRPCHRAPVVQRFAPLLAARHCSGGIGSATAGSWTRPMWLFKFERAAASSVLWARVVRAWRCASVRGRDSGRGCGIRRLLVYLFDQPVDAFGCGVGMPVWIAHSTSGHHRSIVCASVAISGMWANSAHQAKNR
jgi:hypothetical protein